MITIGETFQNPQRDDAIKAQKVYQCCFWKNGTVGDLDTLGTTGVLLGVTILHE